MQPQDRQNFIDWMKAVGMFLIVFGHVTNPFTEYFPVNPKQLGVAFFVFVLGWSLANENRSRLRVIYNRIFSVYFWGLILAVVISTIVFFTKNDLNLSNYMPFFLGINVFVNYFPANPTTWYIGTYLHLILLWAFYFYRIPVKVWMFVLALAFEILSRALIIRTGNPFIAYMLLTNWISLFLLGMLMRNKEDDFHRKTIFLFTIILILITVIWYAVLNNLEYQSDFPFFVLLNAQGFNANIFISLCISLFYLIYTVIFFQICRRLPETRLIRLFAENTLIIFIVHFPVIYTLSPVIYSNIPNIFFKKTIMIVIAYFGIFLLSLLLRGLINMNSLRESIWSRLTS
jgi:fucose 4-O-acetylase-like acetyltransferase